MKTELANEQIEHYQNEGWLIVAEFLTSDELRTMNDAIDAAVEAMRRSKVAG